MGANLIEFDLARVESLAERGLTQHQIAAALGVSGRTVESRIAESSEFSEAVKRGAAKGIAFVANLLMEQAKSGNVTSQIFYLKCRAGWREVQQVDHTGTVKIERIVREVVYPPRPAE